MCTWQNELYRCMEEWWTLWDLSPLSVVRELSETLKKCHLQFRFRSRVQQWLVTKFHNLWRTLCSVRGRLYFVHHSVPVYTEPWLCCVVLSDVGVWLLSVMKCAVVQAWWQKSTKFISTQPTQWVWVATGLWTAHYSMYWPSFHWVPLSLSWPTTMHSLQLSCFEYCICLGLCVIVQLVSTDFVWLVNWCKQWLVQTVCSIINLSENLLSQCGLIAVQC